MQNRDKNSKKIDSLSELGEYTNYSFVQNLTPDPNATKDGIDYKPREIKSGHYVPVVPTPIDNPIYISHSKALFAELGLSDDLASAEDFMRLFSGDTSHLKPPFLSKGWATGYALSIYGSEYYDQCPFKSGNAYGDGRAISVLELLVADKRYEMQLKGGGRTPYCRGADGRAVLRSSVREFLAQEHMHALGIPTSRSLTLYTSKSETVRRPWFLNGSYSRDPEVMIEEDVAITTRVAPSFLRVGQIELFGRRARKNEHPNATKELEMIVKHLIQREYKEQIDTSVSLQEQIIMLAREFRSRLTSLVADWVRVGYCQGNFNSDNCAAGGFTLDYGPFGFMDMFDPRYQPWTGGGVHFSFLNQPNAALQNYIMFCKAVSPLLEGEYLQKLEHFQATFSKVMQAKMIQMWAAKLGLEVFDADIFNELMVLMIETKLDYTIFFRQLSEVPDDISALAESFYGDAHYDEALMQRWQEWHTKYRALLNIDNLESKDRLSTQMKLVNPKYTLREWFLVPAYKAAQNGDYSLIHELQAVMQNPYDEQSTEIQEKYYREKPAELFEIAGVSHVSCSS